MGLRCGLVTAVVALLAAPTAFAGPSLHVGAVEDAAIWGNPNAQMDLARAGGFDGNGKIFFDFGLSDELSQPLRSQLQLK